MRESTQLVINHDEIFPQLTRSPLIEAVIYWQAKANKNLESEPLREELLQRLPNYPWIQRQKEIRVETSGKVGGDSQVNTSIQWKGFKLKNESENRVIQFTPTGVSISHIQNYESWDSFYQEALQLWRIYQEIAQPTTIVRLGVRYINQILLEDREDLSTYFKFSPNSDVDLPLIRQSFFYQDSFRLSNYPYEINWIGLQQEQENQEFLIVDLDVFRTELINIEESKIIDNLKDIRWIKNKLFFTSITETALEKFNRSL